MTSNFLQLAADLESELDNLDRIVAEARQCNRDLHKRAPTYLELRGAGDIVHDFYCAVERHLERIAVELNGGSFRGSDYHAQLLGRMARAVPRLRPGVLSKESHKALAEYLRFRHLFRHRYGFELEWDKLRPLLEGIEHLAPTIRSDLRKFIRFLRKLAE